MKKRITKLFIYKWRFIIGYILAFAVLGITLAIAGLIAPGGVTLSEQQEIVDTYRLLDDNFPPAETVINAPFRALQLASITTLGITTLSIKLSALIIGFISALMLFRLLKIWFKPNVAVLASVLTVATSQFILISQSGTGQIMMVFWPVAILLFATLISKKTNLQPLWQILLAFSLALSIYTPLSIYIILILGGVLLLHPKLRFTFKSINKKAALGAGVFGVLALSPLFYAAFNSPSAILKLLGIPTNGFNLLDNIKNLSGQFFNFFQPVNGEILAPVFGLGTLALMLIGVVNLIKNYHSIKSYIVGAWIILLIPILIINPSLTVAIFIPSVILMATGLQTLIKLWYGIFPQNPYARLTGLLPLAILISGLTFTGIERFTNGYRYQSGVYSVFSKDISIINSFAKTKNPAKSDTFLYIQDKNQQDFYKIVAKESKNFTYIDQPQELIDSQIVISDQQIASKDLELSSILTNPAKQNADRFYIYKKSSN